MWSSSHGQDSTLDNTDGLTILVGLTKPQPQIQVQFSKQLRDFGTGDWVGRHSFDLVVDLQRGFDFGTRTTPPAGNAIRRRGDDSNAANHRGAVDKQAGRLDCPPPPLVPECSCQTLMVPFLVVMGP